MKNVLAALGRHGAELAALLVVTIWGTNFVFQKAALAQFDVFVFNFLRCAGMLVLGWSIFWWRYRASKGRPEVRFSIARRDWPRLIGVGVLGYSLFIPLSLLGLSYTTAFSGSLLVGISPIFAAILLWAFGLERVRANQWLALLLAMLGVCIFLFDKLQVGIQSAGLGDLISLTAAFCWAAYTVVSKPLADRYATPALMAYALTIGAVPVMLLTIPTLFTQDWGRISLTGWGALAWGIVFPVYFAWTVWAWVNSRLGVTRSGIFMYLIPVIGGVTSWFLLGEGFGVLKILGAAVILASLALVRWQGRAKPVVQSVSLTGEPIVSK